METQLTVTKPAELVRQSTDIAGLCRDIVLKSAVNIQGRKYVRAEGWQAIATAHGCIASARDVQQVEGGVVAIGEVRKIADGIVISTAEGFVGEDEEQWQKRPMYARRAMAQTRAISRACRSAFAHVVVLMDAGLSTTPAEEVPAGGFEDADTRAPHPVEPVPSAYWQMHSGERQKWLEEHYGKGAFIRKVEKDWRVFAYGAQSAGNAPKNASEAGNGSTQREEASGETSGVLEWRNVKVHFGKKGGKIRDKALSELSSETIQWLSDEYAKKEKSDPDGKKLSKADRMLKAAVAMALAELKPGKYSDKVGPDGDHLGEPQTTDEISQFNGDQHELLFKNLEWAGIKVEAFMSAAKDLKWIPQEATGFDMMSNETAKKFVDDFAAVQDEVVKWMDAKLDEKPAAKEPAK